MKITSYSKTGTKSSTEVSDVIFGAKINKALLSQAIHAYRSNARQGTSKVKSRSDVNVTHKKVYAQKGTGNARHGSKNAPIFVGGGRAHGPTGLENWSKGLSKKMKKSALISALSAQAEIISILDGLAELNGKTSDAAKLLKNLGTFKKLLIVLAARNELAERSLRNIANVTYINVDLLNALDVAKANKIVMSKEAVKVLEKRLTKQDVEPKVTKTPKQEAQAKPKATAVKSSAEAKIKKAPAKPRSTTKKVKTTKSLKPKS